MKLTPYLKRQVAARLRAKYLPEGTEIDKLRILGIGERPAGSLIGPTVSIPVVEFEVEAGGLITRGFARLEIGEAVIEDESDNPAKSGKEV